MNALQFRTRVAVLWMAVAVATVAQMLLYLLIPGALEESWLVRWRARR